MQNDDCFVALCLEIKLFPPNIHIFYNGLAEVHGAKGRREKFCAHHTYPHRHSRNCSRETISDNESPAGRQPYTYVPSYVARDARMIRSLLVVARTTGNSIISERFPMDEECARYTRQEGRKSGKVANKDKYGWKSFRRKINLFVPFLECGYM